ncbi:MAG: DUF6272 family protein [Bacteroidota bacterium]|nr:DUF6272 family protein [Bacteroidota bacterium]
MQSLTEILYTNNVIFSYYGFIDKYVLNEVLRVTKAKLQSYNEPLVIINRVYNAINECVENIIKHNFFPDSDMLQYKSLLLVSRQNESYVIDTINVINIKQREQIDKQLVFLNSKTKDELKQIKAQIISNKSYSDVSTAGLGLVDMVIRTDSCIYSFKDYNSNFLFNIHFKINSTTNYGNA